MTPRLLMALMFLVAPLAPFAAESAPTEEVSEVPAPDPFDDVEIQRLESEYHRAVIEHHAVRNSARSLLVAAALINMEVWRDLLDRDLERAEAAAAIALDPRTADARTLYERAFERGRDDPAVLWLIATNNHRPELRELAAAAARQLVRIEPDNAAAWLMLLHLDRAELTASEHDALHARASASERYHVYYGEILRALTDAYTAVRPDDALLAYQRDQLQFPASERSIALIRAVGMALAISGPSGGIARGACKDPASEGTRYAHCLRLAELQARHSDTVMDRLVGLGAWGRLTEGTPAHAEVEALRLAVEWQLEAVSELLRLDERQDAGLWLLFEEQWSRPGNDEFDVMRAVIESAGVAFHPPADYVSPRQLRKHE